MHGNIIYGADGQPQTRVATRIIPRYYPCYVFDVSQTDGKPLPELAPELTGDVHRFEQYFEAIKACSPFPVSIENFAGTTKGVCDLATQSIRIKPNMGQTQTLKTLIHETAHALLHFPRQRPGTSIVLPKKWKRKALLLSSVFAR